MKEKTVLILGGTRFFGPALIRELRKDNSCIYRISCFHRGLHLSDFPFDDIRHIIGDRHNESDLAAALKSEWDLIIDLSGTEDQMIRTALRMAQGRCGRYVFFSSSSVYSPQMPDPHQENEPLDQGTGEAYALAKIHGEQIVQELFPHWTIIRPSKVYGKGNYYFSEHSFLNLLKQNSEVILDRDPLLHFTYIDDLAAGAAALMEKDGIYNVAGKQPARLSEFIRIIGSLHGISASFVFGQPSDVPFTHLCDRTLDLSAAKKAAGFSPVVSLEEGLSRTFFNHP